MDSRIDSGGPGNSRVGLRDPHENPRSGGAVMGSQRIGGNAASAARRDSPDGDDVRGSSQDCEHWATLRQSKYSNTPSGFEIRSTPDRPRSRKSRSADVGAAAIVYHRHTFGFRD